MPLSVERAAYGVPGGRWTLGTVQRGGRRVGGTVCRRLKIRTTPAAQSDGEYIHGKQHTMRRKARLSVVSWMGGETNFRQSRKTKTALPPHCGLLYHISPADSASLRWAFAGEPRELYHSLPYLVSGYLARRQTHSPACALTVHFNARLHGYAQRQQA